jgi:hypothetical protein
LLHQSKSDNIKAAGEVLDSEDVLRRNGEIEHLKMATELEVTQSVVDPPVLLDESILSLLSGKPLLRLLLPLQAVL